MISREKQRIAGANGGGFVDPARVKRALRQAISDDVLLRIAETFKIMGDPNRAKLIHALTVEELCVTDLAHLMGLSGAAVSAQLRLLRNLHLVKYRREGKALYYSLDDEHIERLFEECVRHVEDQMGVRGS